MRKDIQEAYNKATQRKKEIDEALKRIGSLMLEKISEEKFLLLKGNHNENRSN